MKKFIFKNTDLLQSIAQHTLDADKLSNPYGAYPGMEKTLHLDLVKDHGVYLMSGNDKNFNLNKEVGGSSVVYALGCNPELDSDWYEECRELGGDDFVEPIQLSSNALQKLVFGFHDLSVGISETEIEVSLIRHD